MTTTTADLNRAHRTDAAWAKTPGRQFTVRGEHFISEYRNAFTGQAIRKDWRMTGCDWAVFNADGVIISRERTLTSAKWYAEFDLRVK